MKNQKWVFITGLLLSLTACIGHKTDVVQWRSQRFQEITSIQFLPAHIQKALGVGQPGMDGIADRGGQFNPTDVVDSTLPMRRFALAGLSSDAVLLAVEHGGRGYSVHVSLIPLTSNDVTPRETWRLFKKPETLRELIEELEKQQNG